MQMYGRCCAIHVVLHVCTERCCDEGIFLGTLKSEVQTVDIPRGADQDSCGDLVMNYQDRFRIL